MSYLIVFVILAVASAYVTPFPSNATANAYLGPISPSGCTRYVNWAVQPPPTGTWSYGYLLAPSCLNVEAAGTRGWLLSGFQTPINQSDQVGSKQLRIRQALRNVGQIISQYQATYQDVTKIFVNTDDLIDIRPLLNGIQAEPEFWGPQAIYTSPVYPPRAIFGINQFNGVTCRRPDGTIYQGVKGATGQVVCASPSDVGIGDIIEIGFSFNYPRGSGPSFYGSGDGDHHHGDE